ncbi:MAG TPA: hypothetical protein DGR79_03645 [Clostridiales bacterium]|nr:hypothetical protein [Clostridiales bacterium]
MRGRVEVTGLPVVETGSGRVLGRVKDLAFDLGRGRLEGLVVGTGRGEAFLPFDDVKSLGEAAVMVETGTVLAPGRRPDRAESSPDGTDYPLGKKVLTRDGRVLGTIDDVIFDPDSGAVWGYQVSAGFLTDFVDGKKAVPLTDELIVGPDSVVVPDDELRSPADGPGGTWS